MTLKLQVNIDGLPLFKSSSLHMWPILGLLLSVPMKEPVVIGLCCGQKKPCSAKVFLEDFVNELQCLEIGFDFEGKNLKLKLDTVICDMPARSFVKTQKAIMGTMAVTNAHSPENTLTGARHTHVQTLF